MRDRLQSDKCARFLKALADPERLRIVQCLQAGPKAVTEIALLLKNELANISHHLGVLRHAGLVHDEKDGKFVIYRLHPDVLQPGEPGETPAALNLGCCRLELKD